MVVEKISNKYNMRHLIYGEEINPKSYAHAVLLQNYYQDHDIDFVENKDWRYYFIVRRHFLRKKRKEHNGIWICHYCGKEITLLQTRNRRYNKPQAITVDHKIALTNGGNKLDTENMVECCSKCNQKKGRKNYRTYMNTLN